MYVDEGARLGKALAPMRKKLEQMNLMLTPVNVMIQYLLAGIALVFVVVAGLYGDSVVHEAFKDSHVRTPQGFFAGMALFGLASFYLIFSVSQVSSYAKMMLFELRMSEGKLLKHLNDADFNAEQCARLYALFGITRLSGTRFQAFRDIVIRVLPPRGKMDDTAVKGFH